MNWSIARTQAEEQAALKLERLLYLQPGASVRTAKYPDYRGTVVRVARNGNFTTRKLVVVWMDQRAKRPDFQGIEVPEDLEPWEERT